MTPHVDTLSGARSVYVKDSEAQTKAVRSKIGGFAVAVILSNKYLALLEYCIILLYSESLSKIPMDSNIIQYQHHTESSEFM